MIPREMEKKAKQLAYMACGITERAAAILDALRDIDAAASDRGYGRALALIVTARREGAESVELRCQNGCQDKAAVCSKCETGNYALGKLNGAESMRQALGVQPAGDGYVFLRGFWDADDDSVMLSREGSAPHAWAILTGEDATPGQEMDDDK